jgi:hypothetical protein
MNKILFVFTMFLASSSLYGQNQNGKVYFIRSEGIQAPAAAFSLFIDQKMVGKLNNKRFSMHDVNPGKHVFSTQFAGKKSNEKAEKIEMQIEDGKSYYVQVKFQHGLFKNKLHFKEIKEADAKKMMPALREIKG